ncbi:MAG: pyridoxal phosphate-dependent aminotransferase family protein [Verrucomicrobia bacterium]|nr:pyridoxal phosphate-dependent aminotransferase family protein [Verrucomicrobiota bacterium]
MPTDPNLVELVQVDPTTVEFQGRRLVYFGGSDYLRLGWHPEVRRAVQRGLRRWGLNVAAGRTTTGNHPVYGELERILAQAFRFPAAVLTSAGYLAPLVAAQGLAGQVTQVFLADTAHGCLRDAARLLSVPIREFGGRSGATLRLELGSLPPGARPLVMVNGLSPLDGTLSPVKELLAELPESGWLLVDDAHGVGTLGGRGGGVLELAGVRDPRVILTGTLSKALGAYGGFVLGSRALRNAIVDGSRVFQGNTPLPPPWALAAVRSLELLEVHGAAWRAQLDKSIRYVREAFKPTDPRRVAVGPAFTLSPKQPREVARLTRRFLEVGIYPSRIRYAQGPADQFFRFAISRRHRRGELYRLRAVVAEFAEVA